KLRLITRLRSNRKNLDEFTSYLLLIIACRNTIASAHTNCLIVLLNSARTAGVFAFRKLFSSAGRRIIQPFLRFATTVLTRCRCTPGTLPPRLRQYLSTTEGARIIGSQKRLSTLRYRKA